MSENKFKIGKELKKLIRKRKKGFTLVELIVVITILAILGTIGFIAFQNYTKSARDGTRIADINMIKQNLGIFITEKGFYPNPDNGTMIKYDGALVRTQGTVGDTVIINLGRMSKKPVDPLTESEYTYSVANNRVEYQIGAISEEGAMAYITNPLTNNAYADSGKKATAMVSGTYNEKFLKVNTGGINYILAIPTIINADVSDTNVNSIVANNKMVFNNYSNLPDSYKNNGYTMTGGFDFNPSNIVVFSGSTTYLDSPANKLILATNLKNLYAASILASDGIYQEIFKVANDTDKVFLVNNYIANNVGGITGQVSAIAYRNCTLDGKTILHGETRDAFSENTILWNATYACTDKTELRTCNDGTLSGEESYMYLTCLKGTPDKCTASGSYVKNGHIYSTPELAHEGIATNITSSNVSENNGVFNYTLTSIECMDGTLINDTEDSTPTLVSCNENYNPVNNTCIAATYLYACPAIISATGTVWNNVDSYTQTWDGTAWSPTSTPTVYNETPSDTACNYKCDTNYTWNGTDSCIEIINGVCGISNGQNLSAEPTTGLCDSGNASTITGTGPWTWTCNGINGGTTANCSTTNYCQVGGVGIGCVIQ